MVQWRCIWTSSGDHHSSSSTTAGVAVPPALARLRWRDRLLLDSSSLSTRPSRLSDFTKNSFPRSIPFHNRHIPLPHSLCHPPLLFFTHPLIEHNPSPTRTDRQVQQSERFNLMGISLHGSLKPIQPG